jgi:hypothetical protein
LLFEDVDETALVMGFTCVRGVVSDGYRGGGIYCSHSSPRIVNCTVARCHAYSGAGVYCDDSSPTISHCVLSENEADGVGGGIVCSGASHPEISHSTISANRGMDAGGIYMRIGTSAVLDYCTITSNTADFWGGGVACEGSTPLLRNCTLVGNEAGHEGGGVWCCYSTVARLEHCIIAFGNEGESVHCHHDLSHPSSVTAVCCDVFGVAEGDWVGCIADQYGINGNISEDPLFCDLGSGDFTLHSDSPCAWLNNPECGFIGAWPIGCGETTAMEAESGRAVHLEASPNPFYRSTQISCTIPGCASGSEIQLSIHDPGGRLVRMLVDANQRGGTHTVAWDGTSETGESVGAGVYFFRLCLDGVARTGRVIRLE